jgi:hypothetical protein
VRPRILFALFVLGAATAAADAQPPAAPQPPQMVVATATKTTLSWSVIRHEPQVIERKVKVLVDGVEVEKTEKATVLVPVAVEVTAALKTLKATDGAGRPVAPAQLPARLGRGAAVVLHSGPLPEVYRRALKDDAVVVELPAEPAP